MSPLSRVRAVAALAITSVIVAAGGGGALADDLYNTLDSTIDATVEATTVASGGTKVVGYAVQPRTGDGDPVNGCNLKNDNALTVSVTSDHPEYATVSPDELTFTGCGTGPSVTVTGVAAGTATISLAVKGTPPAGVIDLAPATFSITVTAPAKKATTTTVTCDPSSIAYTGAARTPCTATVTETVGGAPVTTLTPTYTNNVNVGTAGASATYDGDATHFGSNGSSTFQITPAQTTTTVSCPSTTQPYTGVPQTPCSASVTGPGLNQSLTVGYTDNTNVGTATASASYAGTTNLQASNDTETFAIGAATPTCVVNGFDGTYDGDAHGATLVGCTGIGGAPLTGTFTPGAGYTNVPGGTASWNFTPDNTNYATKTGTAAITIAKATPTCVVNGFDGTYNGLAHGATLVGCTGAKGEALTGDFAAGASHTDVPGGTADWTFTPDSGNYGAKSGTATISIGAATPVCDIIGYTGVYDGDAHGASGSCVGVDDEDLEGDLDLGATFINAPGGSATWSFTPDSDNYGATGDAVEIVITQAAPDCSGITGYSGVYDGEAHGATGTCKGVKGETLGGLGLGASFTDVPGGTASWSIPASTNYTAANGTATITITQAAPDCSGITGYSGVYDGEAHGATGTCKGVKGETLTGLGLGASFTDVPGGTASWSIPASTNYTAANGTATITITQATPNCVIDGWTGTYDGDPHGAAGTCVGVKGETLTGLGLGASFTDVPGGTADWSIPASTNYTARSGSVAVIITQAAPNCSSIAGYSGVYDGDPHGATGTCKGVKGETLGGLDLGEDFTDVPGGTANWSIPASTNYTAASGTAPITITVATPTCVVNGWTGTYDGSPHGASTGGCTGVKGEALTGVFDLGTSFTNAPGGSATWTFDPASANYTNATGSAAISIARANPSCTVVGWTGYFDGAAHGASGSCTGVKAEALSGLDLGATFTTPPGGTANWSIPVSTNYNAANGSVAIVINKWTATGFYAPIDKGIHNTVKAGATVPLKFEVFIGTAEQTSTSVVKTFIAQKVNCTTGLEDAVEEMAANSGTSLRYDSTGGQFIQNWQTPKVLGCYKVTLTTQDGSTISADFKLK